MPVIARLKLAGGLFRCPPFVQPFDNEAGKLPINVKNSEAVVGLGAWTRFASEAPPSKHFGTKISSGGTVVAHKGWLSIRIQIQIGRKIPRTKHP